ncbi:vanillate O-demethylase ferredoxin subunit [Panacagrimonas perspica]|uniref:Vanillate O-demethylase ferredoxin subunit n=1 Tax=Panacagrimonas perspica TaxID=381431 RepID=A0A4S3KBB0_9GAMM|nr:PDR/VanB family oxidoreductase [Panacagrimonas perspica]TDU32581.1 vanillate O-demethylase ferredoxin subunit [Panacagrimonas perspica]THD05478.1 oxidoreductase [Panacagrimonas perspica]
MQAAARLELVVTDVRSEARDVIVLELRDPGRGALPRFTPGAHLELYLPNGLIRHYSLCNDAAETDRYCLGVSLARDSRGGSRFMHQNLRVGTKLSTSVPRNNFPLELAAEEFVFIAGGIGITPILSMIRSSVAANRPWRLFYCARNRQRAAFYEDLSALAPDRVYFHFDDEQQGRLFDAASALRLAGDGAHIYTCGPAPLMKAVESATMDRPADRVHFEWFSAAATDTRADTAFTVVLRNSGARFEVPPGRSILEVLEDHGAGVPYSCREGLCATCRTTVLAGEVDHRDTVLTVAEKAGNREMMICVSRAKSEVLELDL